MADNPLIGQFDSHTVQRMHELLTQALRPIRVRLVNRIGVDVNLSLTRCEFVQLGAMRARLLEDEVRLLARVSMRPAGIPMLLGMDVGLLFRMIGILLGENPYGDPEPVEYRPMTQTDLRIARRLLDDLVAGLQEGLPPSGRGQTLSVDTVTDDPHLELGLGQGAGMIEANILMGDPANPLGTAILALPVLAAQTLLPAPVVTPGDHQRGVARVLPIQVDAVAELGRVKMRLSELESLSTGDVLPLGRPRTVEVRVRDRVALIAQPGHSASGNRCIRVVQNVHDLDKAV